MILNNALVSRLSNPYFNKKMIYKINLQKQTLHKRVLRFFLSLIKIRCRRREGYDCINTLTFAMNE